MILILLVSPMMAGCTSYQRQPREVEEIAIMQVVFDAHYATDASAQDNIPPIYLGVDGNDASNKIMEAFKSRYPGIVFYRFETCKEDADKRVIDRNSGLPATTIEFSPARWKNDSEAEIEIGWYCHPTFSGADVYALKKDGAAWIVVKKDTVHRT
jgi:hypothetical protein